MREILFRGKTDKGKWVEGYYGQFHNRPTVNKPNSHQIFEPKENAVPFGSYIGGLWHEVIPETVGQYTGLTDKNGTKIFEGDIVGYYSNYRKKYNIGIVLYGNFNCSCCSGVYGWFFDGEDIRNHYSYEVMGNIHDNPTEKGGAE